MREAGARLGEAGSSWGVRDQLECQGSGWGGRGHVGRGSGDTWGRQGPGAGVGGVGEGGGSQVEKAGARWGVRDQVGEWSQVGDRGQMGEAVI